MKGVVFSDKLFSFRYKYMHSITINCEYHTIVNLVFTVFANLLTINTFA